MGNNQQNLFKDVFQGIAKYVCSCYSTQLMSIFYKKNPAWLSIYCLGLCIVLRLQNIHYPWTHENQWKAEQ